MRRLGLLVIIGSLGACKSPQGAAEAEPGPPTHETSATGPLAPDRLRSITLARHGEEGELSAVTIERDGRIHTEARSPHDEVSPPPVTRTRLEDPDQFFAELSRRLEAGRFLEPRPEPGGLINHWVTITVNLPEGEHTVIAFADGLEPRRELAPVLRLVNEGAGIEPQR
jgi:hypothetical protein